MENGNDQTNNVNAGAPTGNEPTNSNNESGSLGTVGNSGTDSGALDPSAGITEPKRKRGRPPGSGKQRSANVETGPERESTASREKTGSAKKELDLTDLATQLEGVHKIAALFLKNPTVAISTDEAKKLALAVKNLSKHYNLTISPVIMAWMQLAAVSATIYGPRIAINVAAKKQLKQKQAAETTLQNAGKTANAMTAAPVVDSAANDFYTGAPTAGKMNFG
jgi:hypothetical protein